MNKGSACVDREIITCPHGVDDWYGDKYVANQIKFINQFFGGTGGIEFVFGSSKLSILDLIKTCKEGDSVMIVETLGLAKGYWSLEDIGNACLESGVSFEILNPPFKHCDTKGSKKTLLMIEFANMMARDYPLPSFEDEYE